MSTPTPRVPDHLRKYRPSSIERLMAKVLKVDACWMWQGATNGRYGVMWFDGRQDYAHRAAYRLLVGSIPEGYVIDHFVCNRPLCVNPAHIRTASQRENLLRSDTVTSRRASKRECLRGHPFDAANTYTSRDGRRSCKACGVARYHADKLRKATQ